ncbi:MAG TPA: PadR family transcriptional regulator [Kribbella sp.]|uniref:PadR family transcriptional regulator n=1 Tax=Kribbella sp. TaxID=1871183 RepID=UPI002D786521|nr:PadR family transcriptional regulator [Kribbella sp.]HET6297857.1 PadR family transcriptional regulator [Kribbella sp.]
MALEHAILVSLTERAGSGYELARRFDRSIGFFWAATHQQIYRVLRRMEDSGWVTHTEVAQEGRPDKKVYRVAEAGRAELTRWLAEPVEPITLRDELGIKLRGASLGDSSAVLREVERHRAEHNIRLEVYLTIQRRDFPKPDKLSGRELHQYLVLRGGVRAEQSFVDWCEEVIQALRSEGIR